MPTTDAAERLCPECGSTLGSQARYCGCGWGKPRRRGNQSQSRATGIEDCAWNADGERCHYPGTIWNNVHGQGPGYCCFHARPDIGAAYGAEIVKISRGYQPRTMLERHHAAVFEPYTGPRACQERTCLQRALKGKDLCDKHDAMPLESLRLTSKINQGVPQVGDIAERHVA